MQIQAAVMRAANSPLSLEEVSLDQPRSDELLIKLVATGICHTDIAVLGGHIPYPATPCVLGHEGAGVVVAVGSSIFNFDIGDHVSLSFASCGECIRCGEGHPAYCDNFVRANFMGRRLDGSHTHNCESGTLNASFFGQSSFATFAIVSARNAVKISPDFPLELAGPLGCGLQTGAGGVLNVLKPKPGSSIAVFGAGAVGGAAIMAAKVAGCSCIIVIDMHDSRLQLAKELGATDIINARDGNVVERIRQISGTNGTNFSVEATGVPALIKTSVECLAVLGTALLLGAYPSQTVIDFPLIALQYGRSIRMSTEGDSTPSEFIPRLIELHRKQQFPFEKMVRFYDFDQINQAISDAETGVTIKPIIRMSK
jgi:aryl-alcohol dehydrogenase